MPLCAWCLAPLVDAEGNPCWDVFDRLTFVCRPGCRTKQKHHRSSPGLKLVGSRELVAA